MMGKKMPRKLDQKLIYESEFICLYVEKVEMPDGTIIDSYHRLHYPKESVLVFVINENQEVLLIRSKRYITSQIEWEVPAGSIEAGETAEDAAKREVLEETGYMLKEVEYLCWQNPSNGMSDEKVHLFGAKAGACTEELDKNEILDKKWFSKEEIFIMLKNNEIKCGASMLALLYALQFYLS